MAPKKTQTQHTQEDVLQAVYAGLRLNATGAEIFPHRHHLKQQHKQQAGAWEQIQQTTYPLPTYTALQGPKPDPRCRGKQNCVSERALTHQTP